MADADGNAACRLATESAVPACLADDVRDAAARYVRQQICDRVACGPQDLAGMVDGRLAQRFDQIGGQRQHRARLVDVRDQVDDHLNALFESLSAVDVRPEQREGVGIVGRILEQILGRCVAAERGVQCEHAKIRRRLDGRPPDQRLDRRGPRIGGVRCLDFTQPLSDAAEPVQAVGIARIERDRLLETPDRRFHLVQLVVNLAELMADRAILRPLADQFQQQRLRDQVLLGGDQGLNEIGARCPMGRVVSAAPEDRTRPLPGACRS